MAPPIRRDADGEPVLDDQGQPIPLPVNVNAKRFLFAEDPDVKFGSLADTPLSGFIDSIDMSIRYLSAISQTPPHHLLGQIANLSAEALLAAETALSRKIAEFRAMFGESWERVFRVAAELAGNTASAEDVAGEVLWRDMEMKSLAQAADGLGKLADSLGIPKRGLWARGGDRQRPRCGARSSRIFPLTRLTCPVLLLVVCPDPAVAAWCAEPIRIGDPGLVLTPVVLGPDAVPVVTEPAVARANPELAVLSAMAHAPLGRAGVLESLLAALGVIDQGQADLYAEAVLAVLDARGLTVTDDVRSRIVGCTDLGLLDVWVRRAVTVGDARELFD